eukprot:IDg13718t1
MRRQRCGSRSAVLIPTSSEGAEWQKAAHGHSLAAAAPALERTVSACKKALRHGRRLLTRQPSLGVARVAVTAARQRHQAHSTIFFVIFVAGGARRRQQASCMIPSVSLRRRALDSARRRQQQANRSYSSSSPLPETSVALYAASGGSKIKLDLDHLPPSLAEETNERKTRHHSQPPRRAQVSPPEVPRAKKSSLLSPRLELRTSSIYDFVNAARKPYSFSNGVRSIYGMYAAESRLPLEPAALAVTQPELESDREYVGVSISSI